MHLEVNRADLATTRVVPDSGAALAEGDARIRVDRFGLSSNNISYAVFGDMLRYWEFFPAADTADAPWGRIPVWGFGEVIESRSAAAEVGERLYGYFPMSSELVITPGRSDDRGLFDIASHRAEMAAAYSRYSRCAADPIYRAEREQHQMLLYPLFFTAFLIDDHLADNADFGAEQIVVSSASSKTALGVGRIAGERGARVVGLTSASNRAFVESLEVYAQVLSYDEVSSLAAVPTVYVDIAGNRDVLHAVHTHLSGVLTRSITVGGTHWDHQASAVEALPAPAPEFFFAPDQIAKRAKEWGGDELDRRLGAAWTDYLSWVDGWLELQPADGAEAVTAAYLALLAGETDPRVGIVCTLP
jgi:hypothetical protein